MMKQEGCNVQEDAPPMASDDLNQLPSDNIVDLYLDIHTTKIENRKLKKELGNVQEQL